MRKSSPLRPPPRSHSSCHRLIPNRLFPNRLFPISCWGRTSSPEVPLWWDGDFDRVGRSIRPDVGTAAHAISDRASRRAQCPVSDCKQAAELMESTVAQLLRYPYRGGTVVFSPELDGLLMVALQRALHRRVARLRQRETLGLTAELCNRAVDPPGHTKCPLACWLRNLSLNSLPTPVLNPGRPT
jgi:hypothetical protein